MDTQTLINLAVGGLVTFVAMTFGYLVRRIFSKLDAIEAENREIEREVLKRVTTEALNGKIERLTKAIERHTDKLEDKVGTLWTELNERTRK